MGCPEGELQRFAKKSRERLGRDHSEGLGEGLGGRKGSKGYQSGLSLGVPGTQPIPGPSERWGAILCIVPLGGEEPGVFTHQLPSAAFGGRPWGVTCSAPSSAEEAPGRERLLLELRSSQQVRALPSAQHSTPTVSQGDRNRAATACLQGETALLPIRRWDRKAQRGKHRIAKELELTLPPPSDF